MAISYIFWIRIRTRQILPVVAMMGTILFSVATKANQGNSRKSHPKDLLVLFDNRPENSLSLGRMKCRWRRGSEGGADVTVRDAQLWNLNLKLRAYLEDHNNKPFPCYKNAMVRLLWSEEDGTLVPYNKTAVLDRLSGGSRTSDSGLSDLDEPKVSHGTLDDYRRFLFRCFHPDWIRKGGFEHGILSQAIQVLEEWHIREGDDESKSYPECQESNGACEQSLVVVLTGPWTTGLFSNDEIGDFLDYLKTLEPLRLCVYFVVQDEERDEESKPGQKVGSSECTKKSGRTFKSLPHDIMAACDAGLINLVPMSKLAKRSVTDWSEIFGGSVDSSETANVPLTFGYSCGEGLDLAACDSRLCDAFSSRVGPSTPYRFKRIDLLTGPTNPPEGGQKERYLECDKINRLVVRKADQPEHPIHHFILMDTSSSMRPYFWKSDPRIRLDRETYDRLMTRISRYIRPQDIVTTCWMARYLECSEPQVAGVDPGIMSPSEPSRVDWGEKTGIVRALFSIVGNATREFIGPVRLDIDQYGDDDGDSGVDLRSNVGQTVIWLYSDCQEVQSGECNLESINEDVSCKKYDVEISKCLDQYNPSIKRMVGALKGWKSGKWVAGKDVKPAVVVVDSIGKPSDDESKMELKKIEGGPCEEGRRIHPNYARCPIMGIPIPRDAADSSGEGGQRENLTSLFQWFRLSFSN